MSITEKKLCNYDEVPDPGSKGFIIDAHGNELSLFVVKKDKKIYVYKNSCPHTQGPLDWMPDNFLDADNKLIMCANHGAMFQIQDGFCVYGPCKNQFLQNLAFTVKNNAVYLLL